MLARVKPGDISQALPRKAPEDPEAFGAIMADFERVLVPGLTHWNHPGFLAYFAITASAPGVLAAEVNRTGEVFVSTARVRGHVAVRVAIGHLIRNFQP